MANTVPASMPVPDVGLLLSGQWLDAASVAPLGQASNFAQAHVGSGTPRVLQAFPLRGSGAPGSPLFDYHTNALNEVCVWRIPDTRGVTSVECYVYAKSTSGAGEVEFRSTTGGGVTGAQLVDASWKLHGPYSLDIDASGGYETVSMHLDGNGDHVYVAGVLITVPSEPSPLPAGESPIGCVALDADELGADEPLAADTGAQLRANADALRQVPHVYLNWSATKGSVDGVDGERMVAWPHAMPALVWLDTEAQDWELTIHVRATPAVSDTYVRVHVGTTIAPGYLRTVEIAVPGGGAQGWFTGTIRLPNRRRVLRRMPAGWESVMIVVLPKMTASDSQKAWERREGGDPDMLSTAEINSISIWGR